MSMTIGRARLSTNPYDQVHSGESVTFSIDIYPGSVGAAKVLRQQLTGIEFGEVIPVSWSEDSDFDGYYAFGGATVAPVETYLSTGMMPAAVTLTRVRGGYALPAVEVVADYVEDADVNYNGTPSAQTYIPPTALGQIDTGATTVHGDMGVLIDDGEGSYSGQFWVPPAEFYEGAATVEVKVAGVWYPVVGRQLPTNEVEDVRLSNGVVSVGLENDAGISVSRYPYAVSHLWYAYSDGTSAGSNGWRDETIFVTRNDEAGVGVQVVLESPLGYLYSLTIVLLRGARGPLVTGKIITSAISFMNMAYSSPLATTSQQISASTYVSGHISTNTDADGYYFFGIPEGTGTASVTGYLRIDDGETVEIGVAADSTASEDASLAIKRSERQRVVN